jgi:hypothetical protein
MLACALAEDCTLRSECPVLVGRNTFCNGTRSGCNGHEQARQQMGDSYVHGTHTNSFYLTVHSSSSGSRHYNIILLAATVGSCSAHLCIHREEGNQVGDHAAVRFWIGARIRGRMRLTCCVDRPATGEQARRFGGVGLARSLSKRFRVVVQDRHRHTGGSPGWVESFWRSAARSGPWRSERLPRQHVVKRILRNASSS